MGKVYITALHLTHGGVEMAICLLANALTAKGFEVTILSSYNLNEPVYHIDSNVKVRYLTDLRPNKEEFKAAIKSKNPIRILKEGIYAIKVLHQKKKTMVDAIKSIDNGTIISTRNEHSVILSKYGNKNVKKIAQLHHDHCFDKKLLNDFKYRYNNINYFLLLTDLLTQEVCDVMKGHNSHTKCITMGNFLEHGYLKPFPETKKQVVAVGRLHPVKGFDRLMDIWKIVSQKQSGWRLKIIGDGELYDSLLCKAKALGIADSVELTGAMPHESVMDEMASSKIYAMTSLSEGYPFVMIEAMSCGLPIVAFDVRVGPRAIIENNIQGYLVEDNDNIAFAESLLKLMSQKELHDGMSAAAIEKSKEFMYDKAIRKWMEIL